MYSSFHPTTCTCTCIVTRDRTMGFNDSKAYYIYDAPVCGSTNYSKPHNDNNNVLF